MNKRIFAVILSVCIVFTMLPVNVLAEEPGNAASGSCGDGLTWTLTEDGTLTVSGNGAMEDYYMGEFRPETNVAPPWHGSRESIVRIVVEDGVTAIGDYAFFECSNAQEIILPENMSAIGMCAFRDCSKISEVRLPDGIPEIGLSTFLRCSSLQNVTIPESVKEIGNFVFEGCSSLTEIAIPSQVTRIGAGAFEDCSSLRDIQLPAGLTELSGMAFQNCISLQRMVIPEGVKKIGNSLFYGCSSLTEIELPQNITEINDYAFEGCSSLTEIELPQNITKIGYRMFSGCSSLQKVTLPSGVLIIGENAFSGCSSLTEIVIPESVTQIGEYAFSGCTNLQKAVLPTGITKIEKSLFNRCSSLTEIVIPENVTKLGESAFEDCIKLEKINIPKSVTNIGWHTFFGCGSLQPLLVPASVASIWDYAIPSGATLVGAKGSAAEAYAVEYRNTFVEHTHEWNEGDKSNLSCANPNVTYTCMECCAAEERKMPVPHEEVVPATADDKICVWDGGSMYYTCTLCGRFFRDNKGNAGISREELDAEAAHKLVEIEAKPAACGEDGNIAHYRCENCGKLYRDAEASEEITLEDVVIQKSGHDFTKTEANPASCEEDGNIAYYKCGNCGNLYRDEEAAEEITLEDTVIAKSGHSLTRIEAKPAACGKDGNIEYYKCKNCEKLFRDAGGTEEIKFEDTVIKGQGEGHILTRIRAKPPTCMEEGVMMHFKCIYCGRLFRNAEASIPVEPEDLVVEPSGHRLYRVAAEKASCTEEGTIAYYCCRNCGKMFADASGKNEIEDITSEPLGHKYALKTTKATLSANGGVAKVCQRCGHEVKVSTFYKIRTVRLSKNTYRYTGKAQVPRVEVKDSKGKKISASNYTVLYAKKKAKAVGRYKVTVKFKGSKYSGKKTLYYKILPANVPLKSVSSYADGALTLKWGAKKGIDGYQIRYSKKSSMGGSKKKTVKGAKLKQYEITKLAKGKKYYVQIRGYRKVSGKTYYGAWSKTKSAKTLKMKLNYKSLSMEPGQSRALKLKGAKRPVRWESSNPAVANVSPNGAVTAVADGTATITAVCAGSRYNCRVTVKTVTNYDRLYRYINKNGYLNDYGNYTVRQSYTIGGKTMHIAISYDSAKGEFQFLSINMEDKLAIRVDIGRTGSTVAKCQYVCNSSYYVGALGYADINVPAYTKTSKLNFSYEIYLGGTMEEHNVLANALLNIGMNLWDYYLKDHLGFGLSGLGFSSF